MTPGQMRAWLILEGWLAFPEFLTGNGMGSRAGAKKDTIGLVHGTSEVLGSYVQQYQHVSWDDECDWDDVPDAVVELFYNYIQEKGL